MTMNANENKVVNAMHAERNAKWVNVRERKKRVALSHVV